MGEAIVIIERLIAESFTWREMYKARGRAIEAAGVSIRIKALEDAKQALHSKQGGE